MTRFCADGEGLPFSDEFVRFARCNWEHGEVERGDALHGEDVEWADGDAVLLAVAAVAVDDGEHCARFRLALTWESRHKD